MNFLPTKHAIGRLISFLVTGGLPNDAENFEDSMLVISQNLNEQAYFKQAKWIGIESQQQNNTLQHKQEGFSGYNTNILGLPALPQIKKNIQSILNLFFDDKTTLVQANNKLISISDELNHHMQDMMKLSKARKDTRCDLSELDMRKETFLFYELEKLLIEYQIAVVSAFTRVNSFVRQTDIYDVQQTDYLHLSECVNGNKKINF